ncbi:hypothetical protein BFJ63_vAg18480 [Fusarium oxysporum f. sp. narcissi]|uniref:Uncharacterized protein n=1 Tax=Fusarium oxysporum f. sp. narcissi TaxID=451672 RepID=A0A4Q2UW58_FUSOX|nr:hypothetical protein BFJ63_vAg18480 [Fusarium oxysporum f. sp. narcissi]
MFATPNFALFGDCLALLGVDHIAGKKFAQDGIALRSPVKERLSEVGFSGRVHRLDSRKENVGSLGLDHYT